MERINNHSLMVWRTRAGRMGKTDKVFLKILYKGLKRLSEEEREFLMQKYLYPEKPYTDKEMAELTGLTYSQYGIKRREIMSKMNEGVPNIREYDVNGLILRCIN